MRRTVERLFCRRCKQELPVSYFFAKWVQEARGSGRTTAICLNCAEHIGLYTCTSCGTRLPLTRFSLSRGDEWEHAKKRTARQELSEECVDCQLVKLNAADVPLNKGERERRKGLKSSAFAATLQEAKEQGMSYGKYKALLFRREREGR